MRKANFIVGFNNWGKTTIIRSLFPDTNFLKRKTYNLANSSIMRSFIVQSISNDDIRDKFIKDLTERINLTADKAPDLFAALCPSMEIGNDYRQILSNEIFSPFKELNFFLLKYKWEHHAELICQNIIDDLKDISNTNFYIIDNDYQQPYNLRTNLKVAQIQDFLNLIYL